MTPEQILASGLLQGVNITDYASAIRGKEELNKIEIAGLSDALMKLGNGLNQLQTIIKRLQTPTWLPYVRIGYPEDNPPLIADDEGNLIIQGNATIGGTVEATAFRLRQVNVLDMTLTDDSPSAGYVAWSACSVIFDGTQYSITSGSTDKKFVYWDAGNTTFSVADSVTPQIGRFIIATNTGGAADEAWNKAGTNSIQRSNVVFALLEGFQPRPIATITLDLNSTDNLTIVNDSDKVGAILTIAVHVKTAPTGAPYANIGMVVDGDTIWSHNIYYGTTSFTRESRTLQQAGSGDGSSAGDWYTIGLNFGFLESLTITGSAFSLGTATGEIYIEVWRAWKVN